CVFHLNLCHNACIIQNFEISVYFYDILRVSKASGFILMLYKKLKRYFLIFFSGGKHASIIG
ncbi:hypothetical protein, partial [uncultured Treponema sp.]|uniref:hypothetical protein n=1 Tax=uncultured Treponema sp. TaxID=162155 RepID=UPI0025E5AE24